MARLAGPASPRESLLYLLNHCGQRVLLRLALFGGCWLSELRFPSCAASTVLTDGYAQPQEASLTVVFNILPSEDIEGASELLFLYLRLLAWRAHTTAPSLVCF